MAFLHSKVEVYINEKRVNVRLHSEDKLWEMIFWDEHNQMRDILFIRLRDNMILYIARFLWDYR